MPVTASGFDAEIVVLEDFVRRMDKLRARSGFGLAVGIVAVAIGSNFVHTIIPMAVLFIIAGVVSIILSLIAMVMSFALYGPGEISYNEVRIRLTKKRVQQTERIMQEGL